MSTMALERPARGECLPVFATRRSPDRKTLGFVVLNIMRALGFAPMPWQEQVANVALEISTDTGRFAYQQVGVSVPRQQGKTVLELAVILARALAFPDQNIIYTAQTGAAARQKMVDDWMPRLDQSEFAKTFRKRLANGHEGLRFTNGSRLGLLGATKQQGHGMTIDMGLLDEAWAEVDDRKTQAMLPAMVTRPQPQMWIVSTAGTVSGSPFWNEKCAAGRLAVEAGVTRGMAFFEWAAPDDAPIDDPDTWWATMPALGHTVTEDAVRTSFQSMPRREFERAFLNRPVATAGEPVINMEFWDELADPDAPRPGDVILAVDIAPASRSASIAAAGRVGDLLYVSVLEHHQGTDWIIGTLERLAASLRPSEIIYDVRAAGPLLVSLDAPVRVTETSAADLATACTFFLDVVKNRRLRHRGERELAVALDSAGQRSLGDAWAWSRRNSGGTDISPLVAVTLAAWGWYGGWS